MQKKCLIVGGNGFIGKNLVEKLISHGYYVTVYDISILSIQDVFGINNSITYIEGDVNNTNYLIEASNEVDQVVWLTHTSVPATSMFNIEEDLMANIPPLIRYTKQFIKRTNAKCFIYLSSGGTVYGNPQTLSPISETSEKNPISAYGLTKMVAEEYLLFLLKNTPIKSFILRPSNIFGKYQNMTRPQGIIGCVYKSLLTNAPVNIYGDGSVIRDYLYVSDLIEAIYLCLENTGNIKCPLTLNIGSGKPLTINEIIESISEIVGRPINSINLPERGFDCKYNVLSIEKANDTIKWTPKVDIKVGLVDVWNWMQKFLFN